MNQQIKQRLVGAVVLVSLAVIFIPMLLDGGERSSMPRYGSNIPPPPPMRFEPLEIPLQPVTAIPEEKAVVIDKVEPPPAQPSKAEAPVADPAPKGEVKGVAAEKTAPVAATSPVKSAPAATMAPAKPVPATASASQGDPTAWVVQVGSFGQSDNALALRDKLRRNGFTAFVEKIGSEGGVVYRVRIGPELKRENAERQLALLREKMQLKGIIMGHP